MKRIYTSLAVLMGTLVAILFVKGCHKDSLPPTAFNTPLSPNATAQVVISDRHIAARTANQVKATYVPDGGTASVTFQKDGSVKLDVRDAGFTLRPTLGVMFTEIVRVTAGAQVFYWDRIELHTGLGYPKWCAWGGVFYRLDQLNLDNTSLGVSFTTRKEIGLNLIVRF